MSSNNAALVSNLAQCPGHLLAMVFVECWEPEFLLACKGVSESLNQNWALRKLKRTRKEVLERRIKGWKNPGYSDYPYRVFDWICSLGRLDLVRAAAAVVHRFHVQDGCRTAAYHNRRDVVDYLISDLLGYCDSHTFYSAAKGGHLDLLKHLINMHGTEHIGWVMCGACSGGHLGIIKFLRNEYPDQRWDFDESVYWASCGGHLHILEWLYENDAVPKEFFTNGYALNSAVEKRHPRVVEFLLKHGADASRVNQWYIEGTTLEIRKLLRQ